MGKRKLIVIDDKDYILKEAYCASNGDTVWDIKDTRRQNSFVVHSTRKGELYITFFKGYGVSRECSLNSIKKICEILLQRNLHPTINIYYKNTSLIALCHKVGFRKAKNVKHLYYLKTLK